MTRQNEIRKRSSLIVNCQWNHLRTSEMNKPCWKSSQSWSAPIDLQLWMNYGSGEYEHYLNLLTRLNKMPRKPGEKSGLYPDDWAPDLARLGARKLKREKNRYMSVYIHYVQRNISLLIMERKLQSMWKRDFEKTLFLYIKPLKEMMFLYITLWVLNLSTTTHPQSTA